MASENVIQATFDGFYKIHTKPSWLIDHGMELSISGIDLPDEFECHFSNSRSVAAKRQIGENGVVTIPDEYFLSNAAQIFCWIYLHPTVDSGVTEYEIVIPLLTRPNVDPSEPTQEQQDIVDQAIAALNVAMAETSADAESASASATAAQAAVDSVLNMTVSADTLPSGSDASVTKSVVDDAVHLAFGIPQGAQGVQGEQGVQGPTGATPNFTIGTVQTLLPTQDATATITGTAEAPVLNLGIPKGYSGDATNLAADYSSNKIYAVGEYCIYNGSLYRCTTAITTAEAWTSAHWTAAVLGDDVGDLKSIIDAITDVVQSPNLFDQANATVVEGKYLNYANGNEGTNASYSYCADYIPVKPNTQYYGGVWRKSDGQYAGPYGAFVIFYDENKGYLSGLSGSAGQNPFTTPPNCAFMRLSFALSGWAANDYMFVEESTAPTAYVPYYSTKVLKLPFVIVDANGNGRFTSIADAVTAAESGSTIIVMPGTYEENVKAWTKEIHIIGIDRESCILKDTSGNYTSPPIEIGAGSIQNMSIIEQAEGAGTANMGAYAVHVESNNLFNKKLLIRNCYIYSDSSSAIGMGLRGGCSVRIEDCEIICAGARASSGAAPLYFHDADAQAYWGTANLYLHNNVLRNTASTLYSMLTINSIHKENTTYMHMMYNIFVRSKTPALSQKFNTWNTSGNTDADGWNGLSHMYLEDDSFGNNLTELNYSA